MDHDPKVQIMKEAFSGPKPSVVPTSITSTTRASTDENLVASWLGTFDPVDSAGTLQLYRRVTSGFLTWMFTAGISLSTLTVEDLVTWRDELTGAAATRANRLAIIKGLLSFGYRTGYLRFDIGKAVRAPKVSPDPDARSLTEMQVAAMVHVARQALAAELKRESQRPRYIQAARQRLNLVLWLYYSGCRVAEVAQAQWSDLHDRTDNDFNLSVLGKGSKRRMVVVPRRVVFDVAGGDPSSRQGRVFPVGVRRLQRILTGLATQAGLAKGVSCHWLRHASASHAVDRGAPIHCVQASLGHSSLSTTGRYLHRGQVGAARYLAEF